MKDGRSRAGLDIAVHDNFTDRSRDAHTLSGGESFMAALSLALGLSDVVQQRAGGIKLDVIFIDEGFGSLDDQTLDNALSTLRDLVGNNRAVGVISHVEMVKQQIQAGFEISRGSRGSRVNQRDHPVEQAGQLQVIVALKTILYVGWSLFRNWQ